MTGIRNSNKLAAVACGLTLMAGLGPLPLAADDLILEGSERLSGSVRAISENGAVLLETPLSPAPVSLKGEGVRKVVFSARAGKPGAATCGVVLTNGDVVPGDIESIDDKTLTMGSSITGRVVIPRDLVHSLQFGADQPQVIYAGPDGLEGWSREQATAEHWSFNDGEFRVRGTGRISRDFEVPQQFIVRFKLAWDRNPSLKVYFAAAPGAGDLPPDRYYLLFNVAGIEIKRESSTGKRYTTITKLDRTPKHYPGKHLTIEIRVDRAGQVLQLYLNDEAEVPAKDPAAKAPPGGGISFESIEEGSEVQISKLEVLDWNLKSELRRTEKRGDATKDALVGIKSERFSGSFLEAKKGPEGMLYVFQSTFQDDPIEVPEAEISTIFLVGKPSPAADAGKNPFILQLRSGGSLQVSSCSFTADRVEATHPLLGRLTLQRDGVAAFVRVSAKSKDAKVP
ncbi:MAG: hypothetical protein NTW21_38615 [Verrucomicrobia bacterium]|nr:hypothetical protein [Verrucomicrobiota bacterium]